MALITCPDCGKSVSDAAPACIHCGRPLAFAPAGRSYPAPPIAANPYSASPPPNDPMARRAAERDERAASARGIAMVIYVLQIAMFVGVLPALVGLVLGYMKRNDARGTWVESHFDWQISTFWTSVAWLVVAAVLGGVAAIMTDSPGLAALVAYPVAIGLPLWWIYRVVRGGLALHEGKPIA